RGAGGRSRTGGHIGLGSPRRRNGGAATPSALGYNGAPTGGTGTAPLTNASSTPPVLYVGYSGGTGTLTVQSGGVITNSTSAYVGSVGGAGTVNLYGAWTATSGLAIGDSAGAAGAGIVHVNPGGALTASAPSLVHLYPG